MYSGYNGHTGDSIVNFETPSDVKDFLVDTMDEDLQDWECWDVAENGTYGATKRVDFDCPVVESDASYRAEGPTYCDERSNWPDTPCSMHGE